MERKIGIILVVISLVITGYFVYQKIKLYKQNADKQPDINDELGFVPDIPGGYAPKVLS